MSISFWHPMENFTQSAIFLRIVEGANKSKHYSLPICFFPSCKIKDKVLFYILLNTVYLLLKIQQLGFPFLQHACENKIFSFELSFRR